MERCGPKGPQGTHWEHREHAPPWPRRVSRGSQIGVPGRSQNDPFQGSRDPRSRGSEGSEDLGSRSFSMAGGRFRASRRHALLQNHDWPLRMGHNPCDGPRMVEIGTVKTIPQIHGPGSWIPRGHNPGSRGLGTSRPRVCAWWAVDFMHRGAMGQLPNEVQTPRTGPQTHEMGLDGGRERHHQHLLPDLTGPEQ